MVGILLENLEAQQAGVEVLRLFEITHRDEHVTQALQLDHSVSIHPCRAPSHASMLHIC